MAAHVSRASGEGLLSVVGTPIGNLSDASPRMVEVLGSSDLILCEDTRVTGRLLAHFGLHVPLQRADENVLARRVEGAIERIAGGEHISFVSDAGMPGVSDPGQRLVDAVLDAGLRVEVIPGPSAVTCALVASGLPMDHFFFEGFLPRRRGPLAERLRELSAIPGALVAYESPHRVLTTLEVVGEVLPSRRVALVRELTKLHEEVIRGLAGEVAAEVEQRGGVKGECVLVIEGPTAAEAERLCASAGGGDASLDDVIRAGLAAGESKSALAKRVAKACGVPRAVAYDRVVELSHES